MNILILAPNIPYPADSGNKMRTWNFVKTLASEHEVSLLCEGDDAGSVLPEDSKGFIRHVWIVENAGHKHNGGKKNSVAQRIKNLIKGMPWEIAESYSRSFELKFLEVMEKHRFDIVMARYIYHGQYLIRNIDKIDGIAIVDLDDIETIRKERIIDSGSDNGVYDRIRKRLNNTLLDSYHKNIRRLDKCVICSEKDADYVKGKRWSDDICVVPNSITVSDYIGVKDLDRETLNRKTILYCGDMSYGPNIEGARWFVRKVYPLIMRKEPEIKLHIVGSKPTKEICGYDNNGSIRVFPDVPDMIPYYQGCSLVIVPISIAGGTRIKILEAFACRRPVVSTSIGVEGLDLVPGRHCLVEDSPRKFSDACVTLLDGYAKAKSLTAEGYGFVKENYDIKIVGKMIRGIFSDA